MRTPGYRDVKPETDLVSDEDCYTAMQMLDESARKVGHLQADVDYLEYMVAAAEAAGALYSTANSVDRRKYEARTQPDYLRRLDTWHETKREYLALKAEREAAQIKIEVWRTLRADARARDGRGVEPHR